ncbi:response regulator transcription factor [Dyadobacter luticola]|uniref:response regulator transcription factor n=1 Tax=Dyadobacter luticola TaxID=1979387 RepID=UPI001E3049BD|nr:response regulator transcription factor [Dyadobacter luticola]
MEREAIAYWLSKQAFLGLKRKGNRLPEVSNPCSLNDIEMLIAFTYHAADTAQQIVHLRKIKPSLKILIAVDIENTDTISEVVHCSVHGIIDVHAQVEEWEWAIKSVSQGKVYYAQQVMKLLAGPIIHNAENQSIPASKHFLSKREIEVLMLVASEYSTNRIADKLFISSKTVESHRRNLFQKLGVKNSVGLTKVAVRLGVI